ncbi:MAG: DNA repair protein RecO, partial [Methylocystaceae bacterium]
MPYRESDEIITFFAPDIGKKKALARGVKKAKSALRAPLQPFCHSKLFMVQGRELDTITQAAIIDFFPALRDEFTLSLTAMYIMELLDKGLSENESAPLIFRLTLAVLEGIAAGIESALLLRFFELNLMACLGYRPQLQYCTCCRQTSHLTAFSPALGGIICAECSQNDINLMRQTISGETLGIMRLLLGGEVQVCRRLKITPDSLHELESIMEAFWLYHLEQPLQMKSLLHKFAADSSPR